MKKLLMILLLLTVIVVVGVVVFLGPIIKTAIEEGGEYAFGTKTSVGSVDVGLLDGTLQINDMAIANPAGYESSHFYKMGKARVAVNLSTVSSDVVEINEIVLSGMNVTLERKDTTLNANELMNHAKSKGQSSAADASESSSDEGASDSASSASAPGKKFIVKKLLIEGVSMTANLGLPVSGADASVTLPAIELTDIGNAGEGVDFTELSEKVMQAIMDEAAKSGQFGDLSKMMDQQIDQVKAQAAEAIDAKKAEIEEKLGSELGGQASELLKSNPFK